MNWWWNVGYFQVGWLRASDQTVLSLDTRIVTHNNRIAVSYEAGGCSGTSNAISMGSGAGGLVPAVAPVAAPVHGVIGSNQVMDEGVNCTWRLHIRHLKKSDEGCYMCQINTSPMISELGCLSILGKKYYVFTKPFNLLFCFIYQDRELLLFELRA